MSEQEYTPNKYPIRLGTVQLKSEKKIEIDQQIVLEGIEAEVYKKSNGQFRAEQIANLLQVSLETVRRILLKLNQYCLIYFSPF